MICPKCHRDFFPYNERQQFCSIKCYVAANVPLPNFELKALVLDMPQLKIRLDDNLAVVDRRRSHETHD